MNAQLFAYNNASELAQILHSFRYDADKLRYIIPSRKDKFFFPLRDSRAELWTWQEIYDDIIKSSGADRKYPFSPPDHLLILKSILKNVMSSRREKLSAFPGIDRPGFLDVISDDIREFLNEAVAPDQMNNDPYSDIPSEFLLPEVYSRYIKYLDTYNLLDSAQICSSALETLKAAHDWGKDLVLVFTGFLSFNHGQFELVKELERRCRQIIIIKPEAHLEGFADAAAQFYTETNADISSGKAIELNITEPELEPEVIARDLALWSAGELKNLGEFPGFDSIGLMLSQGREDSFAQAFRRYGVPYDFMSGVPISQTMPGKILSSIRSLSTRNFPTYETAILLAQSCFAGIRFPVMSAYRAGRTGLDSWEKYLSESEDVVFRDALTSIRAIRKFCETFSRRKRPLEIMEAFSDFLNTPGLWLDRPDKTANSPELDETTRLTASAIETIKHKVLTLEELMPDLGPFQDAKLDNEEAYDFLESWCRNTNTRAPVQITNAVRIFTGRPPVLASFPVWIMTGVTQKTWSGNITVSPLLGKDERQRMNDAYAACLPTIQQKAKQNEAVFRRLIHTGEKFTVISRPLLDDEGRPVSESPFMQNFREDMRSSWIFESNSAESINILLGGDNFTFPEIDPQDKLERSVPVVEKKANAVGASDIHELLLCPFLWWQKRQAKIYEQGSELASAVDWGNMLHKYWECVWRKYSDDMNAPGKSFYDIASKEWAKLTDKDAPVSEEYESYGRLIRDPRLARRLGSIGFRVNRLATVQAGIIDGLSGAGYVRKDILLEEGAHLKANIDGVAFLGQCDRIEIFTNPYGAETAFIADYKTGTGERNESKTKIASLSWNTDKFPDFAKGLQLSVYAALFERCSLSGVYILGLESGQVSGTVEKTVEDIFIPYKSDKLSGDIQTRVKEGNNAMSCAVNILERGKFAPEYGSELCRFCRIKSLCRKGEFRGEAIADSEDSDN